MLKEGHWGPIILFKSCLIHFYIEDISASFNLSGKADSWMAVYTVCKERADYIFGCFQQECWNNSIVRFLNI